MKSEKVFVCLDVEKKGVTKYQSGMDLTAVLWIGISSLLLLLVFLLTIDLQKSLLKTDNPYIIYGLDFFIYFLIEQKIVRVFVFHESEMLDIYIQQKLSSNVNLAPYYDVRPDGYELCRHQVLGLFDKCLYNNGKESILINLYQGSKYGRGENTQDLNIATYTEARNFLINKNYRVIRSSYREPNINSAMFNYYDKQILEEDAEFAQDFIKIINHFKSKQPLVYMTTIQIIATTPQQKIDLIEDVYTFIRILSNATYRSIKVLRKSEILSFFKTEYGLNILDSSSILLDTDKNVPLGSCKVLSIHDNNMSPIMTLAKPSSATLIGDDVTAFRQYKFDSKTTKRQRKKQDNSIKTEEEILIMG
ncbi:hypothetical protein [Clostridium tertium]|uniref:hypothetical protein n=1 Tax=Clostridium tertium TaxID=1559 RepID=UPI0023B220F0|nr:hypothetical protein [Clostridium tertium]